MIAEFVPWSRRLLKAAFWMGHILGADGQDQETVRSSLVNLPLAGEIDLVELEQAKQALIRVGLITISGSRLAPDAVLADVCAVEDEAIEELLLALVLERERPLWLATATRGGDQLRSELIPDDVASGIESILFDPARREAFLLARGRVVDAEGRTALGAQGEEFIVALCRRELADSGAPELCSGVRRVSLLSDELGYDVIAPRLDGSTRRLEVKTTAYAGSTVGVFVSRNEYSVGLQDRDWFLVVVRVGSFGEELVGWTTGPRLAPIMPADRADEGRWQSARVRVDVQDLAVGLPPVVRAVE